MFRFRVEDSTNDRLTFSLLEGGAGEQLGRENNTNTNVTKIIYIQPNVWEVVSLFGLRPARLVANESLSPSSGRWVEVAKITSENTGGGYP
jgi:hypothetical protein